MYERDEYFLWWSPFYILLRLSDFFNRFFIIPNKVYGSRILNQKYK